MLSQKQIWAQRQLLLQ